MKTEILTIFAIVTLSFLIGQEVWSQESIQDSKNLEIQFSDNSAQNYNLSIPTDEKFLLSQSYSWSRDDYSRYNLLGYTIDDEDFVEIPRKARGEFTLDILMDTKHTIIFKTIVQYPVEINGIKEFDSSPRSPTSDNWFDLNSEIEFLLPYLIESEKNKTRLELKNWSLDNSHTKTIDSSENEMFVTPKILILDSHNLSFGYQTQHKVEVHSSLGEIKGTGWYDEGTTAIITALGDEGFFGNEFDGWQGLDKESNENPLSLVVDSPKTLQTKWKSNNSSIIVATILAIAGVAFIIVRTRGKTKLYSPSEIEIDNPNYGSELKEFYKQKSLGTISELFEQQLISEERIDDLQKKLEFIHNNSEESQKQS